jgi:hypothetical protein
MKDTDKVYNIKITPLVEDNILLRVPKGVEINEEILRKDSYFEDWYDFDPPTLYGKDICLEISEVEDKELWSEDHPSLDRDGDITFDDDDYCE